MKAFEKSERFMECVGDEFAGGTGPPDACGEKRESERELKQFVTGSLRDDLEFPQ